MTQYCTCPTCAQSPARPANMAQFRRETISGARLVMQPAWTLAHWSGADFADMCSIEIHNFVQLGHKYRVGLSFYLFTGAVPDRMPAGLRLLGLGGPNRYTIDSVLGNQLDVFYKGNGVANPAEVAVMLGCGGTISFDHARQAIAAHPTANLPTITIS